MTFVCIDQDFIPIDQAHVSVLERGFRFGDGVFETIALHSGAPYRFAWHLARLRRGLEAIRIDYDLSRITPLCRLLATKNQAQDGLLRIYISRGIGGQGYLPAKDASARSVIETLPMPAPPQTPVDLWLSAREKISQAALPAGVKLAQGIHSTLTRMEARDHGCFDSLLCNAGRELCETSSANLFWFKNGTLHTPALECGVLGGSIRAATLSLSPYPTLQTRAPVEALEGAEAVFVTNTAWMALPVRSLQPIGYQWKSQDMTGHINRLLAADIAAHASWPPQESAIAMDGE